MKSSSSAAPKQYAGLGVQELGELPQLRQESRRLRRLVADLSPERQIRQGIVSKNCKAPPAMPAGEVGAAGIQRSECGERRWLVKLSWNTLFCKSRNEKQEPLRRRLRRLPECAFCRRFPASSRRSCYWHR